MEDIDYDHYEYGDSRSCCYKVFKKYRKEEDRISWKPPYWGLLCPYPYCPSYRQVARLLALILIALLAWALLIYTFGEVAVPGGQLFEVAVICIAAQLGGWVMSLINMPQLLGMLLIGILFRNIGLVHIEGSYIDFVIVLRKLAFVIILTRAGLDLDGRALKHMWYTTSNLGIIPWVVECTVVTVSTHFYLHLPWIWSSLLGAIISAISPSIVVPCLIQLGRHGYGIAKGIPTLIIAVAVIDDAISVAIFGSLHSHIFTEEPVFYQIIRGPVSIIGGIVFGILWGLLSSFVPEKGDAYIVPFRILMLFGGGVTAVMGSEKIGYGGAGPLGAIVAAFVSCCFWVKQGWHIENNPVTTAFALFWKFFEPILFGLTGTQIRIYDLDPENIKIATACLVAGTLIRIVVTVIIAFGSHLNVKEKIFVALSWMAKATVQAALGPMALDSVRLEKNSTKEQKDYAESVLTICILSIILTAPIGAILITLTGPRLLTQTRVPVGTKRWRSMRSSIRGISITEEEEDQV